MLIVGMVNNINGSVYELYILEIIWKRRIGDDQN